jgi:hypothetical protein
MLKSFLGVLGLNINRSKGIIYCHGCIKPYGESVHFTPLNIHTDTYIEGKVVKCLYCDSILGYIWDAPDIFEHLN